MHDYQAFCEHYQLDPDTAEAQHEYEEYKAALAALNALAG